MRIQNIVIVSLLIASMSTPAFAGDLRTATATASGQQAPERQASAAQENTSKSGSIPKGYLWLGRALFVGGMAVALDGFLNNRNGKFPEFGEATSTNVRMGGAGLAVAFTGGAILFLGKQKGNRPSITFGAKRVAVVHRLSW